jgi:NAD(P)-dependent dehydrogenase (short-subunit alcohol dehydrogenase family)
MGRELVVQLAADGCSVATCDVNADTLAETQKLAREASPSSDTKITTHIADTSDEAAMFLFRDEVVEQHDTDYINLLFNNAGVGGGGSFVAGDRVSWDRTFAICWGGVYNGCRAFVPLLVASDAASGTLMLPAPCSINPKPGIGSAVYCNANFTCAGVSRGSACSTCATVPLVAAAAMLDPDNVRYVPPFTV